MVLIPIFLAKLMDGIYGWWLRYSDVLWHYFLKILLLLLTSHSFSNDRTHIKHFPISMLGYTMATLCSSPPYTLAGSTSYIYYDVKNELAICVSPSSGVVCCLLSSSLRCTSTIYRGRSVCDDMLMVMPSVPNMMMHIMNDCVWWWCSLYVFDGECIVGSTDLG